WRKLAKQARNATRNRSTTSDLFIAASRSSSLVTRTAEHIAQSSASFPGRGWKLGIGPPAELPPHEPEQGQQGEGAEPLHASHAREQLEHDDGQERGDGSHSLPLFGFSSRSSHPPNSPVWVHSRTSMIRLHRAESRNSSVRSMNACMRSPVRGGRP